MHQLPVIWAIQLIGEHSTGNFNLLGIFETWNWNLCWISIKFLYSNLPSSQGEDQVSYRVIKNGRLEACLDYEALRRWWIEGGGGGGVTGSDVNSVLVTVPVDFLNKNSICQSIPVYRFGATIIFVYSVFVCVWGRARVHISIKMQYIFYLASHYIKYICYFILKKSRLMLFNFWVNCKFNS